MDINNFTRSHKLLDLSRQFRQWKSLSPLSNAQRSERKNRAAVLVCLFEEEDVIYVILTKRSPKLSSFSGQVALPGGRTDEGDTDDIRTALREAEEEIGLDPALVDVVTVLEPFVNKGNVTVVPVIGILWNKKAFNPVPNADEVESIFYAPFDLFLKDKNRRQEEREFYGDKCLFHYFDHETNNQVYVIWAVTAAILITAASIGYQRPPEFQPRMPKEWNRNHSRL
ncbi:NUDIX hydrolase domain-containing protein [Artemisia annua]|uniref:NUDIX hydrolase domain-containing protein n=1 Tax=Artemisia annua TaxID=35608 RepID=A0A2U1MUX4_ARTAN|nr:NUDIX hydrolase domain-containing protein [Artemisia annua]